MKLRSKPAVVLVLMLVGAGYAIGYRAHESGLFGRLLEGLESDRPDPAYGPAALERLFAPAPPRPEGAPANVVLIVLDTTRADRMSYAGYPRPTTPHLDRLAADAVDYRNAHSVAPWTLPAHMSMFTGLLPGQHGATWAAFDGPEHTTFRELMSRSFELEPDLTFLPVALQERGYASLGLTTNPWVSRRTDFDTGFDHFYELWVERDGIERLYAALSVEIRGSLGVDEGEAGLLMLCFYQHLLEQGGELEQPFFLFFNISDPHYPYLAPTSWRYVHGGRRDVEPHMEAREIALAAGYRPVDVSLFAPFYDAEIGYVDHVVGGLLDWLREKGLYDDAMIVVTSDHGEHLGERGRFSHQLSVEEELLRVPLLIKYPGNQQAGRVVESPLVSNLDVYETILRVAGEGRPSRRTTPSRDLRDMDGFDRTHLIAEYYHSVRYLEQHRVHVPHFPVDEHRVVRRVVLDGEDRHVFGEPGSGGTVDTPGRRRAAEILAAYLETLDHGETESTEWPLDPKTLEHLQSLGYVE